MAGYRYSDISSLTSDDDVLVAEVNVHSLSVALYPVVIAAWVL